MVSLAIYLIVFLCLKETSCAVMSMFSRQQSCTSLPVYQQMHVHHVGVCAILCLSFELCDSFTYSKQDGDCLLHEGPFTDEGCLQTTTKFNKVPNSTFSRARARARVCVCVCVCVCLPLHFDLLR